MKLIAVMPIPAILFFGILYLENRGSCLRKADVHKLNTYLDQHPEHLQTVATYRQSDGLLRYDNIGTLCHMIGFTTPFLQTTGEILNPASCLATSEEESLKN